MCKLVCLDDHIQTDTLLFPRQLLKKSRETEKALIMILSWTPIGRCCQIVNLYSVHLMLTDARVRSVQPQIYLIESDYLEPNIFPFQFILCSASTFVITKPTMYTVTLSCLQHILNMATTQYGHNTF